jgi:uncharacterized protein with gpF-like domain
LPAATSRAPRDLARRVFGQRLDARERATLGSYRRWLVWLRDITLGRLPLVLQGGDALPGTDESDREVTVRMQAAVQDAVESGWSSILSDLERAYRRDLDEFDELDPAVIELIAARLVKIKGATQTAAKRIRALLAEGVEEGEALAQLQERVRTVINGLSRTQAVRVATTETASGFNGARFAAMGRAEVPRQEWLSSSDELVRETHTIDGEVVQLGESFSNGLRHPHDPAGPPSEVIECRCVALPVLEAS